MARDALASAAKAEGEIKALRVEPAADQDRREAVLPNTRRSRPEVPIASIPRGIWLHAAMASQCGIDTTMAKRAPGELPAEAPGAELQILFGENFRTARLKAGLSQTDVAALSGMAQQTLSQIEAGQLNLTLRTMDRLAKVVDLDVAYLLRVTRPNPAAATRKTTK
jgi:DNA-binding XRE family transcriptional regulator